MQEFLPTIAAQPDLLGNGLGIALSILVTFVVITLVSSYYRFQNIVKMADEKQPEEIGATAEEVLRVQLARYLASCARRNVSFSMGFVRLHVPGFFMRMDSELVNAVKQAARRDDIVCVYDNATAVLLAVSEPEDAETILTRVVSRVSGMCPEIPLDQMRAGIASYPGHGLSGKELIATALEALDQTTDEKRVLLPEIVDEEAEEDTEDAEELEESIEELPVKEESVENAGEEESLLDTAGRSRKDRRKDAVLDPVTGVLKPSAISTYMQRMMSDLRYKKKPVALFCIGINNMDHIERFHGKYAADDVRAGVSHILQANLRSDDLIGRHEKNAFLVLSQCSLAETEGIGKRVSTLVQQAAFKSGGKSIKTSITLGVSAYPEHGRNLHQLYKAGQRVLDYSRNNDIRAYAVYDPEIHDKVPSKPMRSIKSIRAS